MPDIDDATPKDAQAYDRLLILAVRCADMLGGGAEGGAEALCDDCHESVWWSPATVELVRAQGLPVHVRCNQCAGRLGFGGPAATAHRGPAPGDRPGYRPLRGRPGPGFGAD